MSAPYNFRALLTVPEDMGEEYRLENAILDAQSETLLIIAQLQEEAGRGE